MSLKWWWNGFILKITKRKMKSKTSIPLEIQHIKEDGYHIFVMITINGQNVRMLLDTGASRTVFDMETIKMIHTGIEMEANEDRATGLGTNSVENYIAVVDIFAIGGLTIKDFQVGILDLSHVNTSYSNIDMPSIAGVVGSDLLVKYSAVIDLRKTMLFLENI